MPTHSAELTARLRDVGNPWNRWQGSLRCGWLDLPLLRYAAEVVGPLDGVVVNHLDHVPETGSLICEAYKDVCLEPAAAQDLAWQSRLTDLLKAAEPVLSPAAPDDILRRVSEIAPVAITAAGPTHQERNLIEVRFRRRNQRASASCP